MSSVRERLREVDTLERRSALVVWFAVGVYVIAVAALVLCAVLL